MRNLKNKIKNKYVLIPVITALLSIVALIFLNFGFNSVGYKSYVLFLKDVSSKSVSTVYVTPSAKVRVKLNNGKMYDTDNPRTTDFKESLLKDGITVSEDMPSNVNQVIAIAVLVASLIAINSYGYKII